MDTRRAVSDAVSPKQWAVAAGVYMFLCGTVVALALSDLLQLLADVIGLSMPYWMVVLAGPTVPIGAGVWWVVVERREAVSYAAAAAFGLATALLTGVLWTARFVQVWSIEMAAVGMNTLLISVVLGFAAVSGVIVAVPLIYLRRQVERRSPSENDSHSIEPKP